MSAGAPAVSAQPPGRPLAGSPERPPALGVTAGSTRGRAACSVLDTTELRWFVPGPLPPVIRDAMSGATGVVERRCDSYLVDDRGDIGVKLRAGTTLELKVRQALGDWIELGDGLAGVPEQWRKWSPADGLVQIDASSQWIEVHKVIIKRRFAVDGNEVPFSHGPTAVPSGCDVEVAHVDVDGRSVWTVALAAFGPLDARRAALATSWTALAADVTLAAALSGLDGRAMSYPEWLIAMGHTCGDDNKAEPVPDTSSHPEPPWLGGATRTARSPRWARTSNRHRS